MRIEQSVKYAVTLDKVSNMLGRLFDLGAEYIMENKMLFRTTFATPYKKGKENWVRVRMGDVNEDGKDICEITFKTRSDQGGEERESVIDLVVEDYDEAVDLLGRIGLIKKSSQESKRTKYVCTYQGVSYLVSIDEWPWLDDIRFIQVQPISGVSSQAVKDFIRHIQINSEIAYRGGVDEEYKKRYGKSSMEIDDVRFGIDFPH